MRTFQGPLGCHKSPYIPKSGDIKKNSVFVCILPSSGWKAYLKAGVGLSAPPLASRPRVPAQTSSEPFLLLVVTQTPAVLLPFDKVTVLGRPCADFRLHADRGREGSLCSLQTSKLRAAGRWAWTLSAPGDTDAEHEKL